MSVVEMPTACLYRSGFASIEDDLAGVRRRIARGRERATDRADLEELERAQAELRALYRADLRVRLELGDEAGPLDVALIAVDELIRDGLSLRTIPPDTREALRTTREADYALVLYQLADAASGGA